MRHRVLSLLFAALPVAALLLIPHGVNGIAARVPTGSTSATFPIAVQTDTPPSLSFDIVLLGKAHRVELAQHPLRSDDFRLLVSRNGSLEEEACPPSRTYRGRIIGRPDSRVAASINDEGAWIGLIDPGKAEGTRDTVYSLEPRFDLTAPESAWMHEAVAFGSRSFGAHAFRCEAASSKPEDDNHTRTGSPAAASDARPVARGAASHPLVCEIAFDTDVEFYQSNGSRPEIVVHDIESIMNRVSMIYERDLGITYETTAVVVRTEEPDPYGDTEESMAEVFRNEWNNHPVLGGIRRHNAHLLMARDPGPFGIASDIGAICIGENGEHAYAVSHSYPGMLEDLRVNITAHEIGHLWNAPHCDGDCRFDCFIMSEIIGSPLAFGNCSLQAIENWKQVHDGCFALRPAPVELPFYDGFKHEQPLDPDQWPFREGADISDPIADAPSGIGTLRIDANHANPLRPGEARTTRIALGTDGPFGQEIFTDALVSYWARPGDTATNGALVVEGATQGGRWIELARIHSTGAANPRFRLFAHTIPNENRHDDFRLRFRSESHEPGHSWFIDNVVVSDSSADLELSLRPDTVSSRSGEVRVDARIINPGGDPLAVDAWLEVLRPDGSPLFDATPHIGPKRRRLEPFEEAVLQARIVLPPGTPPGRYVVRAQIGRYGIPSPICRPEICFPRPWRVVETDFIVR